MQKARAVVMNMMTKEPMPLASMYGVKLKPSVNTLPKDSWANSENAVKGLKDRLSAKPS